MSHGKNQLQCKIEFFNKKSQLIYIKKPMKYKTMNNR